MPEEEIFKILNKVLEGEKDCLEIEKKLQDKEEIEENEEIDIQKIKPFIIPQIAESKEKDMWTDRIMINKLIESVKQLNNKLNNEKREK